MNKDNMVKKSRKINAEKKAARKPRLTKEEREARKLKLQEERAAKKAERLAKREAKKQKEAERKAAAKAKREERKAKKAARLQAEKERKEAKKLKAKERAEAKKAREAARLEKKAAREAKKADRKPRSENGVKDVEVKKVSVQEKIEAERNEWKALSAIRRYVKSNAKALEELDGDKLARKIKKLQKMGYTIDVENGTPISIGYDFEIDVRIKTAKPAPETKEQKPRKPRVEKAEEEEVQQPQDSSDVVVPEELPEEAEEKLLTDDEIIEAAKQDTEAQPVEVLAGDTFQDETEIAEDDSLKNPDNDDEEIDDEEDDEAGDEDDDIFGRGGDISDEQADYRREAFREMEGNGAWD